MDILTALVSAIALGASEGLKSTASQAIIEAYKAIKGLITRRFISVDIAQFERDPNSPARRAVLAEELNQAEAQRDTELLTEIDRLLKCAKETYSTSGDGVILTQIEAAHHIVIENVTASGRGVVGSAWKAGGDIRISGVKATTDASVPRAGEANTPKNV